MSDDEQDKYYQRVEAIVQQLMARRGQLCRLGRGPRSGDDLEKSMPADVPLHKRGFGVMDELS